MKATIRIYKNDGESELGFPVKLILSHDKKTRRRTVGYSHESDWEPNAQLPLTSHDDFEDLYTSILDLRKKATRMEFRQMTSFNRAFDYFLGQPKKALDFYQFAEKKIERMKRSGQAGNAKVYTTTVGVLQKFRPQLDFKEITPLLVRQFRDFKKAEGRKNSTVKHYLQTWRAIYNAAVRENETEDTRPFEGQFKNLKIPRRSRNYYLDAERIKKLEQAEFPGKRNYTLARDMALLQFYLCGLDFMDINYLKKEQLQNGRVFIQRGKLGEKGEEFDILLPEKARRIVEKWQDPEQEVYVFDFPKGPEAYVNFRNLIYRNLQRVKKQLEIKLLPRDGTFTLKVMRHSFATLGKFARIEEDLLRELMGHERSDIDTVYKDKYPEKERDAAQLAIIKC